MSSFDLDLAELRKRIEELDAVAKASARIRSGGILQIDLVERIPAVVWRGPQGLELLDDSGHRVAAIASRTARPDLPLVVGEGAEDAVDEALSLFAVAGPLSGRIRGLVRVGNRRWDVVLDRDQRILLPEEGARSALEHVVAADLSSGLFARDISHIDIRNRKKLTVRTRPETADALGLETGVNDWSASR